VALVPMTCPNYDGVPPVPRIWGPGMENSLSTAGGFPIEVSSHRRVASVPMTCPNYDEGAPGPSHLGTGDGELTFHCWRVPN
jgi:hypothetical protein